MLQLTAKSIIGLDLAALTKNPSGIAVLTEKAVEAKLVYSDSEILHTIERHKPDLIAIDAPLCEPKRGYSRASDRQMIRKGYKVFPPYFMQMCQLTSRATQLNKQVTKKGYLTIEVHPTSSRKALQILPPKDWNMIQQVFRQIGFKGDFETRILSSHQLDAITAALTARLYLENQTEQIGQEQEGYIIVPKKGDWRKLKV